jgi:3-hydroxyacyl-CoA dehydrogenase
MKGLVVVVGTGRMGPGIAAAFAAGGLPVRLVGRGASQVAAGRRAFEAALATLAGHGLVDPAVADAACAGLETATDLAAVAGAEIVVEATPELLEHKQAFFADLERLAGDGAILATNTSGLPVTRIAERTRRPERVVGTKFVIPAHLVPLVEVVKGERTADATLDRTAEILRAIGKRPVIVRRDLPGFLQNRIQQAMRREAISLVARGVASAEDVDAAIRWGFGFRLLGAGTFEAMDLVGLEQLLRINEYIVPDLDRSAEVPALLRDLVARGETGARAGKGFLRWEPGQAEATRERMDRILVEALKLVRRIEGEMA